MCPLMGASWGWNLSPDLKLPATHGAWNRSPWQQGRPGRDLGPSFLPIKAARPGVHWEGPSPAQPDACPAQDTLKTS